MTSVAETIEIACNRPTVRRVCQSPTSIPSEHTVVCVDILSDKRIGSPIKVPLQNAFGGIMCFLNRVTIEAKMWLFLNILYVYVTVLTPVTLRYSYDLTVPYFHPRHSSASTFYEHMPTIHLRFKYEHRA